MIKPSQRREHRRSGSRPRPRTAIALIGAAPPEIGRPSDQEREVLHNSFARLLDWAARTDPVHGPSSAKDKTHLAQVTLFEASALFHKLCGWAINHCTGLVKGGLEAAETSERRRNHHEWEGIGQAYKSGEDAHLDRRVLIDLLSIADFLPNHLAAELRHGLEALEFGELTPLFAPAPTTARRGKHSLDRLRRRGLYQVHFHKGQGGVKGAIYQQMADAYCVTVKAVLSWEHRLCKAAPSFARFLAACRRAGEVTASAKGEDMTAPRSVLAHSLSREPNLQDLGRMYRETQRRVQKKSSRSGR